MVPPKLDLGHLELDSILMIRLTDTEHKGAITTLLWMRPRAPKISPPPDFEWQLKFYH